MASASCLDRIVKGAPPPDLSPDEVASASRKNTPELDPNNPSITAPHPPASTDPISNLPSSPPQIYLNLLILEASLRAQYLSLRTRLRLHALLLGALAAWTLLFTYLLFLRPREDGKGQGGSVYWMVETGEKLGFVGGAVTWGLVWGTGMWDRGVRWPRRFVSTTNRGLRGFNLKLVVLRGPWYKNTLGYLALLDPFGWLARTRGMRYEQVPRDIERYSSLPEKDRYRAFSSAGRRETSTMIEEDVNPGGDVVRLLLQPKSFSPDFREEWDTFRAAYWDRENRHRADLRKWVKARNHEIAKREGGIFWWTGWRGWKQNKRAPHGRTVRERPSSSHLKRERRREAHSSDTKSGSRSSTPGPDLDVTRTRRGTGDASRRGSSAQSTTRKKRATGSIGGLETRSSSRASTPPSGDVVHSSGRSVTKKTSKLGLQSDDRIPEEKAPAEGQIKEEQDDQ